MAHTHYPFLPLELRFVFFHYVFACLPPSLCEHAHVSTGTCRGQKWVSDTPPEMELQVVVTCLQWVLGMKLGSSARRVNTLNWWRISPEKKSVLPPTLYWEIKTRASCILGKRSTRYNPSSPPHFGIVPSCLHSQWNGISMSKTTFSFTFKNTNMTVHIF